MTVFRRGFSGKNGRDRTAGVTELHKTTFAVWKHILQETVIVYELPAEGINKKEYFNGFMFHHRSFMVMPDTQAAPGNWQTLDAFSKYPAEESVSRSNIRL